MNRAVEEAVAAMLTVDKSDLRVAIHLRRMEGADYAALALWALDQAGASARVFEEVARAVDREGLLITEAEHTLRCWAYEVSWAAETAISLEDAAREVPHV